MTHRLIRYMPAFLLLIISTSSGASQADDPYMTPIKINMQHCIEQNEKDCLKVICLASPDSCKSQCSANAREKCLELTKQTL